MSTQFVTASGDPVGDTFQPTACEQSCVDRWDYEAFLGCVRACEEGAPLAPIQPWERGVGPSLPSLPRLPSFGQVTGLVKWVVVGVGLLIVLSLTR